MSVQWTADDELIVDGITYNSPGARRFPASSANRFRIVKPRHHIERYLDLVRTAHPKRIVELGIFDGGSTALLAQVASPDKLMAIDLMPDPCAALEDFLDQGQYRERVKTYYGVDQTDTGRLSEILETECSGTALDMVIDDASHLLEPTRASFNFLFPRLAPGGVYVIEDWSGDLWGAAYDMIQPGSSMNGARPLSLLIFELMLASAYRPLVVEAIEVSKGWALVRRGPKEIDPDTFDLSTSYGEFGRDLMQSIDAAAPRIGSHNRVRDVGSPSH
jgi:hypothetical protein